MINLQWFASRMHLLMKEPKLKITKQKESQKVRNKSCPLSTVIRLFILVAESHSSCENPTIQYSSKDFSLLYHNIFYICCKFHIPMLQVIWNITTIPFPPFLQQFFHFQSSWVKIHLIYVLIQYNPFCQIVTVTTRADFP